MSVSCSPVACIRCGCSPGKFHSFSKIRCARRKLPRSCPVSRQSSRTLFIPRASLSWSSIMRLSRFGICSARHPIISARHRGLMSFRKDRMAALSGCPNIVRTWYPIDRVPLGDDRFHEYVKGTVPGLLVGRINNVMGIVVGIVNRDGKSKQFVTTRRDVFRQRHPTAQCRSTYFAG